MLKYYIRNFSLLIKRLIFDQLNLLVYNHAKNIIVVVRTICCIFAYLLKSTSSKNIDTDISYYKKYKYNYDSEQNWKELIISNVNVLENCFISEGPKEKLV